VALSVVLAVTALALRGVLDPTAVERLLTAALSFAAGLAVGGAVIPKKEG